MAATRLFRRAAQSAVAWSFAATALRFGSALFVLPLTLRHIPPEELGLWYVFLSLGALASLLDFGFAPAVVRSSGYLWAGARKLLPFGIESAPLAEAVAAPQEEPRSSGPNTVLLARLVATLRVYYAITAAFVLALLAFAGGAWVWHKSAALADAGSIRTAFIVYAFGVSLNFANSLWLYLLAGVNGVRQSQQITVVALLTYYAIAVTGLLMGLRLWALVIAIVAMGVLERLLGRTVFRRLAPLPKGEFDRSLLRALWPNAWRTGAVTLGAYMIVQANTLICSAFLDLRTTASYGLSMQAVTLLVGVSTVWVGVKWPLINELRARGALERVATIFRNRIMLAIATYAAGGIALILAGPALLGLLKARTEFLPLALLATLTLIQFLEMHHSLYAGLVYSENMNPFLKPALISGVLIVAFSVVLTPRLGVWGLLLSTGLVQLCYNNWWPVLRGIRGLGDAGRGYWAGFFVHRST